MSYDGTLKFDTKLDTGDFEKGTGRLGDIVKGMTVFKLLEAGFNAVKSSVGGAIERVDILNAYPKVLQQMGVSAEDAAASTKALSLGLQGLPTTLPEAVAMSQQFIIMGKDADIATRSTLGINNALLASGANFEKAQRGGEAYITMLQQGKVDMQHWNTLLQTAPYAISKLAESYGFGADGARKLYDALKDGSITMDDFNLRMIELSEATGGFAEVAKTSTAGIGTSWQNMKNAIVRGVADVITALDDGLGETRFKGIAGVIDEAKNIISRAFAKISAGAKDLMKSMDWKSIERGIDSFKNTASKAFDLVGKAIKVLTSNMNVVVPLVKAFLAAWAGYKVLQMASTVMDGINKVMKVAQALYTVTIGLKKAEATATTIAMQAQVRETGAKAAATLAQYGLNASLLACPITWIVAGIAAVTAGLVIFYQQINKASAESLAFAKGLEESRGKLDDLKRSVADTEATLKTNIGTLEATARAEKNVASAMDEALQSGLAKADLDSRMTGLVNEFNALRGESVLKWDAEKRAIYDVTQQTYTNTEAIRKNIDARLEQLKVDAYSEDYKKSIQERVSLEERLVDLQQKKNEQFATSGHWEHLHYDWLKNVVELGNQQNEALDLNRKITERQRNAISALSGEYIDAYGKVTNSKGEFVRQMEGEELLLYRLEKAWGLNSEQIEAFAKTAGVSIADVVKGVSEGSWSIYDVMSNTIPVACDEAKKAFAWLEKGGEEHLHKLSKDTGLTTDEIKDIFARYATGMATENDKMWMSLISTTDTEGSALVGSVKNTSTNAQASLEKMDGTKAGNNLMGKANTEANTQGILLRKSAETIQSDAQRTLEAMDGTRAGSNLIAGATRGAEANKGSFLGTISSIATQALGLLSKVWDQHSPSRAAAEKTKFFVLGLIQGVESMRNEFLGTISDLAEDALGSADYSDLDLMPDTFESGKNAILGLIDGMEAYKERLFSTVDKISQGIFDRFEISPNVFKNISSTFAQNPMNYYGGQMGSVGSGPQGGSGPTYNLSINGLSVDQDSEVGQLCTRLTELLMIKEGMRG